MRRWLRIGLVLVLCILSSGGEFDDVSADAPAVFVRPTDPVSGSGNISDWLVVEVGPDLTGQVTATVANPANVAQEVELRVRDAAFDDEGRVQSVENARGFDSWIRIAGRSSFVLGPGATREVELQVSLPTDLPPGDHIGMVLAATSVEQGGTTLVRQVGARLYVTVPGEAAPSFEIADIGVGYDFWLWPSEAIVTARLTNTGNVRVAPNVVIRGSEANGPSLLLSRSSEQYVTNVDVPWYGTILRLPVRATTEDGLVRSTATTRVVVPVGLIILLVVAGSALYAGRRWWKNRKSQTAELKQDIQRLEQLITQQAKAQQSTAGVGAGLPGADDVPDDEEAIILAALKRARRSDDDTALARIALAKHMTSGGGLDLILEALQKHDGKHRGALLDAAVSYGADALSTHERFAELSDDTQAELGERLVTAGEPVSGNGNGKPAKVPQPVVGQTDSDVLRTELAKVKGVGPAKQEALVSRFGSLDALRAADVEDLTEVPGIGYATARDILDQLDG